MATQRQVSGAYMKNEPGSHPVSWGRLLTFCTFAIRLDPVLTLHFPSSLSNSLHSFPFSLSDQMTVPSKVKSEDTAGLFHTEPLWQAVTCMARGTCGSPAERPGRGTGQRDVNRGSRPYCRIYLAWYLEGPTVVVQVDCVVVDGALHHHAPSLTFTS